MKTNLMHCLSSVYFVSQPLHVSGISVAHHQEVYRIYSTYIYTHIYSIYVYIVYIYIHIYYIRICIYIYVYIYVYVYIYIYAEIVGSNPTGGMDICLL